MTGTQPAVTMSWDDGRSLGIRQAHALFSQGLPATFYVLTRTGYNTLRPVNLRDLSRHFEVGADTLNHAMLTGVLPVVARQEIFGARSRMEDITDRPRCMSWLAGRKFAEPHLAMIRNAGCLELPQTREAAQQSFLFRFSTADNYRILMEICGRARAGYGRP
jgi:peptidoglycan/xylan/chitin deacetylase (PgdA/CDA1 family)